MANKTKPDVKNAVAALRIAWRSLGVDQPTVNLSVAVALHCLTGEKPPLHPTDAERKRAARKAAKS